MVKRRIVQQSNYWEHLGYTPINAWKIEVSKVSEYLWLSKRGKFAALQIMNDGETGAMNGLINDPTLVVTTVCRIQKLEPLGGALVID